MTSRLVLLAIPLLLAGCAGAPAEQVEELPTDSGAAEETRLADDVQEGEEWTDTPMDDEVAAPEGLVLTMAEVEMNDSEASCWSVIDGQVYDLTEWISRHPGGASRIIQLCGTDGTSLFQGQHGGSSGPESTLEAYLLGSLQER
jgi:cytochrome b involved in lipid metabolism